MLFFQACNLLAIVTIVLETPVKRGNREFSTKLKIFAVLALGLTVGSVTMWWYNWFSSQNLSQMALKATVLLLSSWSFYWCRWRHGIPAFKTRQRKNKRHELRFGRSLKKRKNCICGYCVNFVLEINFFLGI